MATVTRTIIGPADHGRRMTLDEFSKAEFVEGWLYELSRGVVDVTEVPGINHGRIVYRISQMFGRYEVSHPGVINYRAGGAECRIRLPTMQSDRHPDHAVYLSEEPSEKGIWTRWVPDIAIEVVSRGSKKRDFVLKYEEYLQFGVREYWILDPNTRKLHVFTRSIDVWKETEVAGNSIYRTHLLPGLEVHPDSLFGPVAMV